MSITLSPKETDAMRMRRMVQSRQDLHSPSAFGCRTDRFKDELTGSPGVGQYNLDKSTLLKDTPSLSKKGYVASFVSKAPKLSFIVDKGTPGPCSYDIYTDTMAPSPDALTRPSTAFIPSGDGRVPFPPPNKVPGPAAYSPHEDPGSPFLRAKTSATFSSKSKRESFIQINDVPHGLTYEAFLVDMKRLSSPAKITRDGPDSPARKEPYIPFNTDIQFYKSTYTRFQDVGRDNKVPGPQRYFDEDAEKKYYHPQPSLRSVGNYQGRYCGKIHQKVVNPVHTFGADKDRFKDSAFGRLDLKALIPGPGSYFEDLGQLSAISADQSPRRTMSPVRSIRTSHSPQRSYADSQQLSSSGSKKSTRKSKNPSGKELLVLHYYFSLY